MSLTLKFHLIILLVFCGHIGYAFDITPLGIYRATKEACTKITMQDLHNLNADKLRAGYFPSKDFTEIMNFIRRESAKQTASTLGVGLTSVSSYIISEPEFYRALNECYPHSQIMRSFFVESVQRSDRAGKAVAFSTYAAFLSAAGILPTLVTRWKSLVAFLQYADKAVYTTLIASLLKSDSKDNTRQSTILTGQQIQNKLQMEKDSIDQLIISLRSQIQEAEQKIRSCGHCVDSESLSMNKQALLNILQVAEKSTLAH